MTMERNCRKKEEEKKKDNERNRRSKTMKEITEGRRGFHREKEKKDGRANLKYLKND